MSAVVAPGEPDEAQRRAIMLLAATCAGIHRVVKQLEAEGVERLDPVACAMEEIEALLVGVADGLTDAESSARNR